jgi:hypothetical protein
MAELQLASPDVDELFQGVAQLDTRTLDQFTEKVLALRAKRHAPTLRHNEARLLQKINQGVPAAIRQRFEQLRQKLNDEEITTEEHSELLRLTEQIELADVNRLNSLIELAHIRNTSIDGLMQQSGKHPPSLEAR